MIGRLPRVFSNGGLVETAGIRRWRWVWLFPRERKETLLERVESCPCIRGNIICIWHTAMSLDFAPGCLLPAQVSLDPWERNEGPQSGPAEWEGPAELSGR